MQLSHLKPTLKHWVANLTTLINAIKVQGRHVDNSLAMTLIPSTRSLPLISSPPPGDSAQAFHHIATKQLMSENPLLLVPRGVCLSSRGLA